MGALKKNLRYGSIMSYEVNHTGFKYETPKQHGNIDAANIKSIEIKKGSFFSFGHILIETFTEKYDIEFPSKFNNDFMEWKREFDAGNYIPRVDIISNKPDKRLTSNHEKNEIICSTYRVNGVNPETGRRKTKTVVWEKNALKGIIEKHSGLMPPYEIEEMPEEKPTESQCKYAKKLGITFPADATVSDASIFITRAQDNKPLHQCGISRELAEILVFRLGIYIPVYAGISEANFCYYLSLSKERKIEYFAMKVYCENKEKDYLFPHEASESEQEKFKEFAKRYIQDEKFMESFERYSIADMPIGGKVKKKLKAYDLANSFL